MGELAGNGKDSSVGIEGYVEDRVFLLRKKSWRFVSVQFETRGRRLIIGIGTDIDGCVPDPSARRRWTG